MATGGRLTGRVARALAAGLVLVGVAPVAAAGPLGPVGPVLVVTGDGPTQATFSVGLDVRFDGGDAWVVLGPGATYGGVLFREPRTGGILGGAYRIAALEKYQRPRTEPLPPRSSIILPPRVIMPAGTYRVYLIADGPVEVRIPLQRGRSQTVRPSTPNVQQVHVEEHLLPADTDPDRDSFVVRYPFTRPNEAYTEVVGKVTGPGVTTEMAAWVCTSRKAVPCRGGTRAGPYPRIVANQSVTVATGLTAERVPEWSTAGKRYGIVQVESDRTAGGTVWLAYLQVHF